MERTLSILLAFALALCGSVTAFADDYSGSGQSEIRTHIYSRYEITIPAVIDLSYGDTAAVTISNADIEDNYSVNVYVTNIDESNTMRLTHESGNGSISCAFVNNTLNTNVDTATPLVSFAANDISEGTATKDFGITCDNFGKAGNYSGVMAYRFECVNN